MPSSLKGTLETILVVDDDAGVLEIVTAILERANFRVLSAVSGSDALKLSAETAGKIHLLLSAVDMAQISGPDLGQALKKTRLDLHVMLMSGGANGNLLFSITESASFLGPVLAGTSTDSASHGT